MNTMAERIRALEVATACIPQIQADIAEIKKFMVRVELVAVFSRGLFVLILGNTGLLVLVLYLLFGHLSATVAP